MFFFVCVCFACLVFVSGEGEVALIYPAKKEGKIKLKDIAISKKTRWPRTYFNLIWTKFVFRVYMTCRVIVLSFETIRKSLLLWKPIFPSKLWNVQFDWNFVIKVNMRCWVQILRFRHDLKGLLPWKSVFPRKKIKNTPMKMKFCLQGLGMICWIQILQFWNSLRHRWGGFWKPVIVF